MQIVKDKIKLSKPIKPSKLSAEEIQKITDTLTTELEKHGGIGLSANQLGLDVRACIIKVIDPLVLINPTIIERSEDAVAYVEQCLSIDKTMKSPVKTIRSKRILVETDNLGIVEFKADNQFNDWKDSNEFFNDSGLLECVVAQHEIDHLDGILITDISRKYSTTYVAPKSYGRNEMVMVKLPDGKTEFMKYKKAQKFLELGAEIV
jgi:peptide deformylase